MEEFAVVVYEGRRKKFPLEAIRRTAIADYFQLPEERVCLFNRTRWKSKNAYNNQLLVYYRDVFPNDIIEVNVSPNLNFSSPTAVSLEEDYDANGESVVSGPFEYGNLVEPAEHIPGLDTHLFKQYSKCIYTSTIYATSQLADVKWFGFDRQSKWIYGALYLCSVGLHNDEMFEIIKYCPTSNTCLKVKRFFGDINAILGYDENNSTFMIMNNVVDADAYVTMYNAENDVQNDFGFSDIRDREYLIYSVGNIYAFSGNKWIATNTRRYLESCGEFETFIREVTFDLQLRTISIATITSFFKPVSYYRTSVVNDREFLIMFSAHSYDMYDVSLKTRERFPLNDSCYEGIPLSVTDCNYGYHWLRFKGSQDVYAYNSDNKHFRFDFVLRRWIQVNIIMDSSEIVHDDVMFSMPLYLIDQHCSLIRDPSNGRLNAVFAKLSFQLYRCNGSFFDKYSRYFPDMQPEFPRVYKQNIRILYFRQSAATLKLSELCERYLFKKYPDPVVAYDNDNFLKKQLLQYMH